MMAENETSTDGALTRPELKTPRAAATAGVAFALLYATALLLIRLAIPAEIDADGAWLDRYQGLVKTGLALIPFAGIAFLWFIGVIRDRLGQREDQFFATVFFGSGILMIGMIFVSAAMAGGLLNAHALNADLLRNSDAYAVSRASIFQIMNVYGVKMSGVFMLSLGTIWLRTRSMPRWIVFGTYGLALLLILVIALSIWITLVFPVWVLVVSLYILVVNRG